MHTELTQFRRKLPRHPLHNPTRIKENTVHVDPKTLVTFSACDQPFHKRGAGVTRNLGIKVLQKEPANKIIIVSERPLQLMDLVNFTQSDYERNGWYVHGLYAIHCSDFSMLANARIPISAVGDL